MIGVEEENLRKKLFKSLNSHASRIDFISLFIAVLCKVRTVNLAEIGRGMSGGASAESKR